MLNAFIFSLVLYQLASGAYVENTEFDKKIADIVKDKAGGNPDFLKKFVNEHGIPKGLGPPKGFKDNYCFQITEPIITSSKYSNCVKMEAVKRSIFKLNSLTGFEIFKFSVNLQELKNIELELVYQSELTYLYFSAFRKCDNCLFNLIKNPSLIGIRFWHLSNEIDINTIEKKYRPKLFIRGNRRLKLERGDDTRRRDDLMKVCNPEMCVIQRNEECHFRYPITSRSEYKDCQYVYGDMHFSKNFRINNPVEMNFKMDGCFVFNRTGIQYARPILKAFANCTRQHIFENNKYMCTDQLEELEARWGANKFHITSDNIRVKCYQGECRGGFVSERIPNRYTACEVFRGNVHVNEHSGNLSDRIRDLSYAHLINGSLHIVNNPSITNLALPFLKKIDSAKCPALVIQNMKNLESIIFHSHIEFHCNSTGPKVLIRNSSKLYLHHQILRQMRKAGAVLEGFDSNTDSYSEKVTLYLIGVSFVIVIFVEIIWALRRNLLLPNFIYRLFPMTVQRKPKQKQARKKKTELA